MVMATPQLGVEKNALSVTLCQGTAKAYFMQIRSIIELSNARQPFIFQALCTLVEYFPQVHKSISVFKTEAHA